MATSSNIPYLSHIERTATSPRDPTLHAVTLSRIDQINESIRLLRLNLKDPSHVMTSQPGHWLDVYVPTLPKPGGFTTTSPPACSLISSPPASSGLDQRLQQAPYIELAIQRSPSNPPAAYLWRPEDEILGKDLDVRVGGDFVWPPLHRQKHGDGKGGVKNLVLLAGGVGINPLMAIIGHLAHTDTWPDRVRLLYAARLPESGNADDTLFVERLRRIVRLLGERGQTARLQLDFYLGRTSAMHVEEGQIIRKRRVTLDDVKRYVCDEQGKAKDESVVYVCGPKGMTDEFVEGIRKFEEMREDDVLCEKWW